MVRDAEGPVPADGGLAALVQQELRLDPFSGAALAFRARRADRAKILVWDGAGMVLIAKRLDEGKFAALFEGRDWRRVHARRVRRPAVAGSAAARQLRACQEIRVRTGG